MEFKFTFLLLLGGLALLVGVVGLWLRLRRNWEGYYGYQQAGSGEITVVLKEGSDLTSYALDFAMNCLGLSYDEALRQVRASLADGAVEIYLANSFGEKYLLKTGSGHTVISQMLNEELVKKETPWRKYEQP